MLEGIFGDVFHVLVRFFMLKLYFLERFGHAVVDVWTNRDAAVNFEQKPLE